MHQFRVLLLAAAAALLSACADFGLEKSAPDTAAKPPPITRSDELLAALDRRARTQDQRRRVGRADAAPAAEDLPDVSPAALVGAEADRVRGWLGRPALEWREGEHAMWQYVTDECVIHLFVNGRNRIEEVALGRRDGDGDAGCEHAIAERLTAARPPQG